MILSLVISHPIAGRIELRLESSMGHHVDLQGGSQTGGLGDLSFRFDPESPNSVAQSDSLRFLDFQARERLSYGSEKERRYFAPISDIDSRFDLSSLESVLITQSYFPKEIGEVVLTLVSELDRRVSFDEEASVKQIRLRESCPEGGGTPTYELVVKSKHHEHGETEVDELTISLSEQSYERLLSHATNGTVQKRRYHLPVEVVSVAKGMEKQGEVAKQLCFEIDVPLAQSKDGGVQDLSPLQYTMADLEVDDPEVMEALRKGQIRTQFSEISLDISNDQGKLGELRKVLSWKRIASKGIDKKARKSLTKLNEEYQQRAAA